MSAPDEEMRDLVLALSAYLRGDVEGMAAVVARHPDRAGLLSKSLALNMFFLRKAQNPQAILDQILAEDPLALAVKQESATGRARRFLLEELKDGPVRASVLRQRARKATPPIGDKALDNAALSLALKRGQKGDTAAEWSLPPEKSSSKPQTR